MNSLCTCVRITYVYIGVACMGEALLWVMCSCSYDVCVCVFCVFRCAWKCRK